MTSAHKNHINLLPQEAFSASTYGRILAWLTSSFRVIVILTNMVVIIAFLSRFWLDSRRSDLNQEIKQKKAILSSTSEFENEFRDVQKRLTEYKKLRENESSFSNDLRQIASATPGNVRITDINLNNGLLAITGNCISTTDIEQFVVNLASLKSFGKITIGEVSSSKTDPNVVEFKITGNKLIVGGIQS